MAITPIHQKVESFIISLRQHRRKSDRFTWTPRPIRIQPRATALGHAAFPENQAKVWPTCTGTLGSHMPEQRMAPRRRVLKPGTIALGNGGTFSCIIRNISGTGAAIEIESPAGLSKSFTLIIGSERFQCHVTWHRGKRIGVKFS